MWGAEHLGCPQTPSLKHPLCPAPKSCIVPSALGQTPQQGAGGCHPVWPWVSIWGSRHFRGKNAGQGDLGSRWCGFIFRDAPGTGTPVQWQGTQAGEGVKDGRCQLQKFYHIWRLFLKAQLLAACETPGSHWRYGCAVSPHGRGSLSPPCREGFALGKGNNHSENFLLGFVVACWGRKIISWRGGDVGCSLPSRQTRGAAGGRRDRLQELHQENPVGTSWPWDVPPAEGAGVQGGCHVPLSSTQMSPGCCGTPVALAEKS